ncbi:MAG: response regulator [Actinomycetota bacterium]
MARVLVVDDDPDLLTLVRIQLRHHGHTVMTASSGIDALELVAAEGAPDVAVLDVSMPGMTGLELLGELRSLDGFADLPAVFLSARTTPDDIKAGTSLGARYLTKPYVMAALLKAIEDSITP